jgi:hypothetical protein
VKLSVRALVIAGALFKAVCFLFVAIMNIIVRPYGGAYLALLTSLYPGYHPETGPVSLVIGTLYALVTGALGGAILAWLYNTFAERS